MERYRAPAVGSYVWELQVEMNDVVRGRRYVVGATRLIEARERQGVGLAGTDTVGYTEIRCGATEYRDAEEAGILRALGGVSAPPGQPPTDSRIGRAASRNESIGEV